MGHSLKCCAVSFEKTISQINGLEDTTLVLREGNTITPGSVQVLHINGNHWITIPQ